MVDRSPGSTYPIILWPSILQAYLKLSSPSPLDASSEKPKFSCLPPHRYNRLLNGVIWASSGLVGCVILSFWALFGLNFPDSIVLLIGLTFLLFAGSQTSIFLKSLYRAKYQERYQEYRDDLASRRVKSEKLDSYAKVVRRSRLRKELKAMMFRQQILKELLAGKVAPLPPGSPHLKNTSKGDELLARAGGKFFRLMGDTFGERFSRFDDSTYLLVDPDTNLHLIVFIDIPYTIDKSPLHWMGDERDAAENQTFLDGNWIVVRLAEQQVALSPDGCCRAIAKVYALLTQDERSGRISPDPDLMPVRRWTREEAEEMAIWEVRNYYHQEAFLS